MACPCLHATTHLSRLDLFAVRVEDYLLTVRLPRDAQAQSPQLVSQPGHHRRAVCMKSCAADFAVLWDRECRPRLAPVRARRRDRGGWMSPVPASYSRGLCARSRACRRGSYRHWICYDRSSRRRGHPRLGGANPGDPHAVLKVYCTLE